MTHMIEIIKNFPGISDWRVREVKTTSYETFFVHRRLETVRATSTTDTTVTVYVDHDGMRGDSVFSVYASTTDADLHEKLTLAVTKAKLVNNQPYTLPEGGVLDDTIYSNMGEMEPKELACEIANACFDANEEARGSINALEIFIDHVTVHVVNSRGVDKRESKHHAMVEAIPTWTEGGESVELYECYHFSTFDYETVKGEICGKMHEVRDRYHAVKPAVMPSCPVILNAPELGELMWNITGELGYAQVYARANAYAKDTDLQTGDACDRITLRMRGRIEGGKSNSLFDADGVTLDDVTVIEAGRVVAYHGGNRFAQYLDAPVTGNLPCMELAAGKTAIGDIEAKPYLECVSMSGLQVDIYNDYIGGEVRLAYYFDGEKRVALTGISISGKLSEALSHMTLSREVVTADNYRGPKKAVFEGIAVI